MRTVARGNDSPEDGIVGRLRGVDRNEVFDWNRNDDNDRRSICRFNSALRSIEEAVISKVLHSENPVFVAFRRVL